MDGAVTTIRELQARVAALEAAVASKGGHADG
jgi:hypothetical protein